MESSFSQRFQGKTTHMDKDGIVGIISQQSIPVDKTNASPVNLSPGRSYKMSLFSVKFLFVIRFI